MSGRQLCTVHLCTAYWRVAAAWRRRSNAGFTLIELLVAITLFALLTAILASGLRFGARVWEQADAVAEQVTGVESAYAIVRRLIATALPLATTTLSGEATIQFQGSTDAVSFVGPAPVQAFCRWAACDHPGAGAWPERRPTGAAGARFCPGGSSGASAAGGGRRRGGKDRRPYRWGEFHRFRLFRTGGKLAGAQLAAHLAHPDLAAGTGFGSGQLSARRSSRLARPDRRADGARGGVLKRRRS
ncbi:type II secretion system protein [Defluviicoccus vanus]|uniref:Type II secretion system protein n=1 Tax=Defluviicoccus vanus TaxID=111831 RepID=A0A7H1MYC3_9PROT|nr:type II secretion system protein [Defluviicoccus vanus]